MKLTAPVLTDGTVRLTAPLSDGKFVVALSLLGIQKTDGYRFIIDVEVLTPH